MTEDEREKAQEQMKALNQAYSELSQHCSDQNNSSEEVGLLEFVSIAFSFRKRRHLLFSCMTNNFPFVQCERPCCITLFFFYFLTLEQSRKHSNSWEKSECAANMLFSAHLWSEMLSLLLFWSGTKDYKTE